MKGLTIWQPWASLVASGYKWIETRGWDTRYRGPLLIHAAASGSHPAGLVADSILAEHMVRAGLRPDSLPFGKVLAVARLADCVRSPGAWYWGDGQAALGDLSRGRFAWILRDVARLDRPAPWKGSQGLWDGRPFLESCPDMSGADRWSRSPGSGATVQGSLFPPIGDER